MSQNLPIYKYCVAGHSFAIVNPDADIWTRIGWHYDNFAVADNADVDFTVNPHVEPAAPSMPDGNLIFSDKGRQQGDMGINVYRQDNGHLSFALSHFGTNRMGCLLTVNADLTVFNMAIYKDTNPRHWHIDSMFTSAMLLSFVIATALSGTLVSHSAAVIYNGKAYIFIGRSGTGKSTHARLWLRHIAGSWLLNDDHPIVGFDPDGHARVYGSPWSGKTDCYNNHSAPLAAIVRLQQAPENQIRRQVPMEAYASLISSFSGMTMISRLADARHEAIERLVASVPAYILKCLPDAEAAEICYKSVTK